MTDANSSLPIGDAKAISGLMGLALEADEHGLQPTSGSERFAAPLPEELADKFPGLEILERVGSGGMGCVYKARQTHLDRIVALKLLPAELGRDPKFAERFTREARALAQLVHPNIVTIHDFGQVDGLHYLVMEFMDGMSLRELMNVEDPGSIDVVDVLNQICAALQYAHDAGIVHRDIKPENILFDRRGHLKLADFGLVKLAVEATQESLTGSRQAMGTLHYMAPEQWENPHDVDHRADLYALGVMLYELVTGRLPLGHFDPPSVLANADTRIDDIVMRAMQSNVEQRYQNASELSAELRALQGLEAATPGYVQAAGQGGTFTRLMNFGGYMQRMARRSGAASSQSADQNGPWVTMIWLFAIFCISLGGDWVNGRGAFDTSIPGIPVEIPNSLPFCLGVGVLMCRLFRKPLDLKGDLLTVLLAAAGIAHSVLFYVFWVDSPSSMSERVSILPGVVGFLFVLCLLEKLWTLMVRATAGVATGARAWGSWVGSLNERVMASQQKSAEVAKESVEKVKQEQREARLRFWRRLKKQGIGPRRMWEIFGVDDEPAPTSDFADEPFAGDQPDGGADAAQSDPGREKSALGEVAEALNEVDKALDSL